jgi:large subunit ribosomal protein L17
MRHQRAGVHLSRTSAHRKALFSNLIASLFTYERIRTTDAKAKETRRLAERTITWARRLGDVLTKEPEKRNDEEKARVVHAVRMARRVVRDRGAVVKLFDEIGPRYLGRHGGYTRIVKIGQRAGDAAPMSLLELIPDENAPARAPQDEGEAAEAKGTKASAKSKAPKAKGEEKAAKPAAKAKAAAKASAKPAAKADKPAAKKPAAAKKKPSK